MNKLIVVLVFGFYFCAVPFARAQSAEEMVSNCEAISEAKIVGDHISLPQDFQSGVCWGAFLSFQSAIRYADNTNVDGSKSKFYRPLFQICAPPDSTASQLIKVFMNYASRHPEQLSKDYFRVALSANKEAFPCSN